MTAGQIVRTARGGLELGRGVVLVVVGLRTIGAAAQLLREARTDVDLEPVDTETPAPADVQTPPAGAEPGEPTAGDDPAA